MQALGARLRPAGTIAHRNAGVTVVAASRPAALTSSSLFSRQCGLLPLQPRQQQRQRQCAQPAARSSSSSVRCSAAAASFDGPDGSSGGGAHSAQRADWRRVPAALAAVRAVFFYLTTFVVATPLFLVMLACYPYVMKFDKYRCGTASGIVGATATALGAPAGQHCYCARRGPGTCQYRSSVPEHAHGQAHRGLRAAVALTKQLSRPPTKQANHVCRPLGPVLRAGGAPSTLSTLCGPS